MIANKKTLLSIAVALAVTACGGGGSASVPPSSSSGQAVDGYLSGSSVLCDTNNNGVADAGESKVLTNSLGNFTFSPACASTIVIWGGTNIDGTGNFKGLLKAPAGSTVATPLTSLMVSGGLTAAQLATALGLPDGTDVSKTDPVTNAALHKKTLAMQQIIQQVANTLGGLAGTNNSDAIQAIYSQVAKAVASTLAANSTTPLVDTNGKVSSSLVSSIVKKSVENVASTTDTALATAKAGIGTFNASKVAELISGAIVTQATTLVNVSDANLVAQTTLLGANLTIANTATQCASLLVSTSTANLTTLAEALISNDITKITDAANVLGVTLVDLDKPSNYLSIVNDSIKLNATSYTLSQFMAGLTLAAKPDTVSFAYAMNGKPIPAGGSLVSVGLEMTEASTGRALQVILDQVNLVNTNGTLSVAVPAGAKLYAYGKTSKGASANMTFSNDVANQLITTSGTSLEFHLTNVLNSIESKAAAQPGSPFANLLNVTGTFTLKVLVSNMDIQSATTGAVKGLSVSVTGSDKSISGLGVEGKFTLN